MNGIDYFERGWSLNPKTPCFIEAVSGNSLTYNEVRTQTFQIANAMKGHGYDTGSKGAVLGLNELRTVVTFLSLIRLGVATIPINPRNSTQDNAWILQMFDCEILFFSKTFAAEIPKIKEIAPGIKEYVCIDGADGYVSLDDWTDGYGPEEFEIPHDPDRIYLIQPTGGTTGLPKGVMVANKGMENHVANMMAVAPCDIPPVFLAAAPLTHAAGYIMQTVLCQNGTNILLAAPEAALLLSSIPKFSVTHTFLPPTVIYSLIEHPDALKYDYSSMRYFLYGASPMAPEKVRKAIQVFGPVLCQVYGQSETSFPNTFLSPQDHVKDGLVASDERLSSCGKATPFCRLAIVSDGKELTSGQVGEFAVRGNCVMLGYYENPEATAEVSQDGWHLTGDVGYRDEEGYFYLVDRKKDMIISGGFNIYSVEVETALLSHPAVQNCAVIGIPDSKWGEMVAAELELVPGLEVTPEELIDYCKELIGSMKSPKRIEIVAQLPKSSVGKILKRDVRAKYWENQERMVN